MHEETIGDKRIQTYTVKNVRWKGHLKRLSMVLEEQDNTVTKDQQEPRYLDVPLSACVSGGDTVFIEGQRIFVCCKNGDAQLAPAYLWREKLSVGGLEVDTLIKEITQADEHLSCISLAKFHYRDQPLFGRTSRLIARTFHPAYPKVLGYIELATPFYMNKARAKLLNFPFRNGRVSWEAWDMQTTRQYIHLIVRIARFVIHPEFRGLGLGQILTRHAAQFARTRWQVAGLLPYFLEISADMLKYVPFAERAGMLFIGETEGNLDRVVKDMGYLMKNAARVRSKEIVLKDACGIVDKQVANMERALKLQKEQGWSRNELLNRLKRLSVDDVLQDYDLFWDIVSLPKPTYMQGLNKPADRFISRRVAELSPTNDWEPAVLHVTPLDAPIQVENLTLKYISQVRRTRQTHAIQQAFGISPENINNVVVQDLSLNILPKEVVLITGPSGSGKTTLLNALAQRNPNKGLKQAGHIAYPENVVVGAFEPIRSEKALVEIFSAKESIGSVRDALYLMGSVGLSDAFVLLKRFSELSTGQQYRAMLASLIARCANVWVIDEFCASLDTVTANVIADRLQKMARRLGATLVVAAPHCELFLHALRPDKVVLLTNAWEHKVESGAYFMNQLKPPDQWRNRVRQLHLKAEPFAASCRGDKTLTIRKNCLSINPGPLLLTCGNNRLLVNVVSVEHLTLAELTEYHAQRDGFPNLDALHNFLHDAYPSLTEKSSLTAIEFERF